MTVRSTAYAEWHGSLQQGKGEMKFGRGAYHGEYTRASRFETGEGTNPEELLAAAHAGCFSMQLSGVLGGAGHAPTSIKTTAHVTIAGGGVGITKIEIETEAVVPGIDEGAFQEAATKAKEICPVSRALASVPEITLKATLLPA